MSDQDDRSAAHDEGGASAVEYGLIAALVALAMMSGLHALGSGACATFGGLALALVGG